VKPGNEAESRNYRGMAKNLLEHANMNASQCLFSLCVAFLQQITTTVEVYNLLALQKILTVRFCSSSRNVAFFCDSALKRSAAAFEAASDTLWMSFTVDKIACRCRSTPALSG